MRIGDAGKPLVYPSDAEFLGGGARPAVKAVQADRAAQILEDAAEAQSQAWILRAHWFRDAFGCGAGAEEAVRFAPAADTERDDANTTIGALLVTRAGQAVARSGRTEKLSGSGRSRAGQQAQPEGCNQRVFPNHWDHDRCHRSDSVFPCWKELVNKKPRVPAVTGRCASRSLGLTAPFPAVARGAVNQMVAMIG